MSYKLEKPFKKEDKFKFIADYNHNLGMRIEETETALYALEDNEIIENGYPAINPDYDKIKEQERIAQQIQEIQTKLAELDGKRIRAICENEIKDSETGETWLEYYNKIVINLRTDLTELLAQID